MHEDNDCLFFLANDRHILDYSGSILHICLLSPYILPKTSVFGHCRRQSRHSVYAVQLLFCSLLKTELENKFCINFSLIFVVFESKCLGFITFLAM